MTIIWRDNLKLHDFNIICRIKDTIKLVKLVYIINKVKGSKLSLFPIIRKVNVIQN